MCVSPYFVCFSEYGVIYFLKNMARLALIMEKQYTLCNFELHVEGFQA
jgi:hypothetical protein